MAIEAAVASNLKVLREKHGLTQEALAHLAGISVSLVSLVERGERSPLLATIERLADALKEDPLEFFN
ncbi:MAG TPA: helix-turn-helix transcriptional regulator [Anaeromyxobacteraceae bacterium]|nr:helix-turn-helix transcriptional regulator [Anaeromyxobacteraceae bacterium]